MKKLEEFAKEYAESNNNFVGFYEMDLGEAIGYSTQDFIAGAQSKWVQVQILQAKIDGLVEAFESPSRFEYRLAELEQQLKQLEDE